MKNNKKKKILIILGIIVILMLIVGGVVINKIFNRVTSSARISSSNRNEKWIKDIEFLKDKLPKKHKNLFFYKSKEEFNNEINELIKNIPSYTDEEVKGKLVKIITSINDSHTSVGLDNLKFFPLKFFEFEDGIYLIDGEENYKDYWGQKLIAINGYEIEEVKEMIKPYISKDNSAIFKNQFSNSLTNLNLLSFSGIADNDEVTYTFTDGDITVKALSYKNNKNMKFISENNDKVPLSKQNNNDKYWFKYLEDENIVYVKYNSCSNMEGYSFKEFTNDVFQVVDKNNPDKLVVDFRDNGGGNSAIFNSFLEAINEREDINKTGKLYAIIGRSTFSSAILNTMDLKKNTNATLVGESTGGQPNHFGEVKQLYLSNTNITVYYSSNYFKTTKEDVDSIYPDKEVTLKASSFFEGKDDFLEAIINEEVK
ncbi:MULTISPECIES: peptidase S41 [unclassified Clostridium]|uniref:peptidase S41 n=1 Tax=unclassified Clostridium TaxID=2614128 RepID=UPI00280BF99C|nr:peptidase S41 [Clostridium sp.]MDY4252813.1 peptidase S41 [Clostridium sp.]